MGETTQSITRTDPNPIHNDTSNSATVAPSQQPPSKIPLRPQKIRKLSPDTTATTSQIIAVEEKTPKPKPKPTARNSNKTLTIPRIAAARSLSCEGELEIALRHLRNSDPVLASLIDVHPPPTFDSFHTPFLSLTRSILYQQLAYKAGTSIYTRFVALCGGENGVVPETILTLTPQQLRQIGVSGRKAGYLHDLAKKYQNGILSDSAIVNMDDKSLFTMLTMVNGIGSWSVHMFMIFSLHRPDVLPINDLGIRKGVQILYDLEELPRPSQMEQLCEKWRPYRSVAAWYLWRFAEEKGTPSTAVAVAIGAGLQQRHQHQQVQHQQVQHQQVQHQQVQHQQVQHQQVQHQQVQHQQVQQQQHPPQPQLLEPINSVFHLGVALVHEAPNMPDFEEGRCLQPYPQKSERMFS